MAYSEKVLEYDKLKFLLTRHTCSELGRCKVEQLEPIRHIGTIRYQQKLCAEAKSFYQTQGEFPLKGIQDISPALKRAKKNGAILHPDQLNDISNVIGISCKIKHKASKLSHQNFPNLFEIFDALHNFPHLVSSIKNAIGPKGEVLDSASTELRSIRRELAKTQKALQSKLESVLQSPKYHKSIQESVITSRNGRYVIPIKQDAKGNFQGVIHGQSTSGATLFMEPFETVEINNRIAKLIDMEQEEIRRVLYDLTAQIYEIVTELENTMECLGELDFLGAKARLSLELKATEPKLNKNGFTKLIAARHPLLGLRIHSEEKESSLEDIVPTDMYLGGDFNTMVITGPNTGGKTVALKAFGLLTLMAQSGLHIPAKSGSEVAVFDHIFADIGDEQSIEQNLSTFSSHMTKIIGMLKNMTENSLVLLDEVGAGTDPAEGAALGMAVIDWLTESAVKTIATTHHSVLKAHAHNQDGMINASMAFDWSSLRPSYRLQIGVPGGSNAINIAERLGMPDTILESAKSYMGEQKVTVEDLLIDMQEARYELETERDTLQRQIELTEERRRKYEMEIDSLRLEQNNLKQEAKNEAASILKNARRTVEETIAQIRREQASKESVHAVFHRLDKTKQELQQTKEVSISQPQPPYINKLRIGDKVLIQSLNRFGEIISLEKDNGNLIRVQIGSVKMRVPKDDIGIPLDLKNTAEISTSVLEIQHSKTGNVQSEINLIGRKVDDALSKVDKYLDDVLLSSLSSVRIIHGKGTGVLRDAIQNFLSGHPSVLDFNLAPRSEGGRGATVVKLKE